MSATATTFVTNANEFVARLDRNADKIKDPKKFLNECRRLLAQQEFQVWATDGAALEETWKALVQPQRKFGGRLMVDTGDLMHSMSNPSAGTIRGTVLRIHPKPFYGRFHQFGTARMDARPFSGISDATARELRRLLEQTIQEDMSSA